MLKKIVVLNQNSFLRAYRGFYLQLAENVTVASSTHHNLEPLDVIQKFIECTEEQAVDALNHHKDLQKFSGSELLERLDVLKETGVADIKQTRCLILAKYHRLTLKNRILSMHECGINPDKINSTYIKRFLSLTHLQVNTLKDLGIIDKDTDVYKKLCANAQLLDYYTPVDDKNNIVTLKIEIIRLLLKKEIGMDDERFKQNLNILKRLKNKSIQLIRKNIEIARSLGMSSNRICRNPFVLWADPDNSLKVIKEIDEIGGIDIKMCLSLYPKILLSSYENTSKILECLKEEKFSDAAIQRSFGLFTLSYSSVKRRLKELKDYEFFIVFKQHPMALKLVYYFESVKARFNLLKEININNPTICTLSTTNQKKFMRFYEHGLLRQPSNDIINYICGVLECNEQEFRYKIRNFYCWRHVPTVELAKNVSLFKEKGFKNEEIFEYVQAIFYHRSQIIEVLNSLEHQPGLECCKDENGAIKKELILPLIIYFIEKKFNFSIHSFVTSDEETHSDIQIPEYKFGGKIVRNF